MRSHTPVFLLTCQTIQHVLASSIINVKNTTSLGPQLSPDVTDVSRDGGYSALINGNIVFFYDDTECFDSEGDQLSFVSNTAAYASKPNTNILEVEDFGVVDLGTDTDGSRKRAILADSSVETGGWIPFSDDELHFNKQKKGKERVAICTSCTACLETSAADRLSSRAWNVPDFHQHYSSLPICASRLC